MPLYMTQFAYIPETWATLTDNPEDGSAAVREWAETIGRWSASLVVPELRRV